MTICKIGLNSSYIYNYLIFHEPPPLEKCLRAPMRKCVYVDIVGRSTVQWVPRTLRDGEDLNRGNKTNVLLLLYSIYVHDTRGSCWCIMTAAVQGVGETPAV